MDKWIEKIIVVKGGGIMRGKDIVWFLICFKRLDKINLICV